MEEQNSVDPSQNSGLPPILTYFGQFIDHDITAMMALDEPLIDIHDVEIPPSQRADISASLVNARTVWLDLDSLYGGDFGVAHLDHLLRSPSDRAKMWVAPFEETPDQKGVTFPKDRDGDVLRLKRLTTKQNSEDRPVLTKEEIMALPTALRDVFVNSDGSLATKRAVIGDPRNDENLFISQLHLAFLRLHNGFVDVVPSARKADDSDKVFAWAKKQVQLHYQWLVANVYLPSICDPVALGQVIEGGAAMYRSFVKTCDVQAHHHRPMLLEFSLAAFRMGHSMVRGAYDWNKFFGRSDGENILPDAPFGELFRFTGSGGLGGLIVLSAFGVLIGAVWS